MYYKTEQQYQQEIQNKEAMIDRLIHDKKTAVSRITKLEEQLYKLSHIPPENVTSAEEIKRQETLTWIKEVMEQNNLFTYEDFVSHFDKKKANFRRFVEANNSNATIEADQDKGFVLPKTPNHPSMPRKSRYKRKNVSEFTPLEKAAWEMIQGYEPRGEFAYSTHEIWPTYDVYTVLEMVCNFNDRLNEDAITEIEVSLLRQINEAHEKVRELHLEIEALNARIAKEAGMLPTSMSETSGREPNNKVQAQMNAGRIRKGGPWRNPDPPHRPLLQKILKIISRK